MNKLRFKVLIFLSVFAFNAKSFAQEWSIGAIALTNASPFMEEGTSIKVLPNIGYRGDRFYSQGLEQGFNLVQPDGSKTMAPYLDIIGSFRFLPGDLRQDLTYDLGAKFGVKFGGFDLSFQGLQEISGAHKAQEYKLNLGYTFFGDRSLFSPAINLTHQPRKMANYLWGLPQSQIDKLDRPELNLTPFTITNSVTNIEAGGVFLYQISDQINFVSFGNFTYLDKDIRLNPNITKKYEITIGFGFTYTF